MSTLGNHGIGYPLHGHGGKGTGSGAINRISPFGRATVTGKAGDVRILPTDGMSPNVCQYQAILVQACGGGITVEATLAPIDLALNPDQTGIWSASKTIASGALEALAVPAATALKITFTAAATVYVAVT